MEPVIPPRVVDHGYEATVPVCFHGTIYVVTVEQKLSACPDSSHWTRYTTTAQR